MKAPLALELKLKLQGVMPQERLAALIVMNLELRHLKLVLGYMGLGCHQAYRGQVRPLWDEVCRAQAGYSEAAERILNQCVHVVKVRLSKSESAEAKEIRAMMDKRPSELSDEDRQRLVSGIMQHAFAPGDNQESLRREFRQSGATAETLPKASTFPRESEINPLAEGRQLWLTLEQQHLEIKALAMGCGITEKRAEQVSRAFFTRQYARTISDWSARGAGAREQERSDQNDPR